MDIETLLQQEIESELQTLGGLDPGSNEYKAVVDGVTKLIDRAIEMDKFNIEHEEKISDREFEREHKLKQMEEEQKDRFVKNLLNGVGIGLPLVVTIWGTLKSLKFEETGTVTTIMGRGFINKLLPKK